MNLALEKANEATSAADHRLAPSTPPDNRVPEFDGLRGLAIALVLWHHLVEPYLPQGAVHWLGWLRVAGNLSWCGVDLFLVLSGYFIGGILIDHRNSPQLCRVFYLRRALRILPLYYVALACCLLAVSLKWLHPSPTFSPWAYALFLSNFDLALQNYWEPLAFSVLWSLAVEEQFYFAAPWVARWIPPVRLPWFLAGLIALAAILRIAAHWTGPGASLGTHVLTPMRMDTLALGVLVAWAVRAPAARPFLVRLERSWPFWLAAALVLLAVLAANRPPLGSALMVNVGYALIAAACGLLVLIVAAIRPPTLGRALRLPLLTHLGRRSFFVYLWHALIGQTIIQQWTGPGWTIVSWSDPLIIIAGIGATWLAAMLSWNFFEAPLISIGRKFAY